jgi:hypothetical protein
MVAEDFLQDPRFWNSSILGDLLVVHLATTTTARTASPASLDMLPIGLQWA